MSGVMAAIFIIGFFASFAVGYGCGAKDGIKAGETNNKEEA